MSRRLRTTLLATVVMLTIVAGPATAAPPEGCRLFQPGTGTTPGPDEHGLYWGFDDQTVRSCKYKATRTAGYEGSGTWRVDVQTSDTLVVRTFATASSCADQGFIQPGDIVTVTTRTVGNWTTAGTRIAAGPTVHC